MSEISMPKVSVVCAWYNRADYIRDTVDSLLAQNYLNFDITVVNDGSTDSRVREIFDSYTDCRLRVIHQENSGFTRAIRRAIDESNGVYIAIQGAGDVSFPGRLAAQVAHLESDTRLAVAGCRYVRQVIGAKRRGGDAARKLVRSPCLDPTPADIVRGNPFSHGEVMLRRAAYDFVGGYRAFFENAQDKDLWLRIGENFSLGIVDETHYQRNIFMSDGISSDFSKTLKQIAYSRIADLCHMERSNGRKDSVELFGQFALLSIPRDLRTTLRIVRAVRHVVKVNGVFGDGLSLVKMLFGSANYLVALMSRATFLYLGR